MAAVANGPSKFQFLNYSRRPDTECGPSVWCVFAASRGPGMPIHTFAHPSMQISKILIKLN